MNAMIIKRFIQKKFTAGKVVVVIVAMLHRNINLNIFFTMQRLFRSILNDVNREKLQYKPLA